jgi:Flp pilus assembly protein TadG
VHQLLTDNPLVAFTIAFVRTRLEPMRERSERGASALETAIIAAVLIACAVFIGGIVLAKVHAAGNTVTNTPIPN